VAQFGTHFDFTTPTLQLKGHFELHGNRVILCKNFFLFCIFDPGPIMVGWLVGSYLEEIDLKV